MSEASLASEEPPVAYQSVMVMSSKEFIFHSLHCEQQVRMGHFNHVRSQS